MTVALLASQVPPPQPIPAMMLKIADAGSLSGGNAPVSYSQQSASQIVTAGMRQNATRADLDSTYGGGGFGIARGLTLTAPSSGLLVTVSAGHATIGGIVEIAADTTIAVPNVTGRAWIWLTNDGQLHAVSQAGGGPVPAAFSPSSCLLGSVAVAGGNASGVDTSGVVYQRQMLYRETSDAAAPSDSPDAGLVLLTKTQGGLYLWAGGAHTRIGASAGGGSGVNVRGVWSNSANYAVGDIVSYGGGGYIASATSTNVIPSSDATKWTQIGSKGDPGTAGAVGSAGTAASSTTAGVVKTDSDVSDPIVYLKLSVDSLLGGKRDKNVLLQLGEVQGLITALDSKLSTSTQAGGDLTGTIANLQINPTGVNSTLTYGDATHYVSGLQVTEDGRITFVTQTALPSGGSGSGGGQFFSGANDPPPSGTGANGDLYFVVGNATASLNGNWYQKLSGTWTYLGNLRGPAGAGGGVGPQGQGFTQRGAWAAATAYNAYDVVTNGGQTYVAPTNIAAASVFNPASWTLWAAKGAQGDPGTAGAAGASGKWLNEKLIYNSYVVQNNDDLLFIDASGGTFTLPDYDPGS